MAVNDQINLFEVALEESCMKHFDKLFSVLMTDPSPESFGRFEKGLDNLLDVEAAVEEMIKNKYGKG